MIGFSALRASSLVQYWLHAFCLLLVFWLPVGLLRALDGLLVFMTPWQFLRELPLVIVLIALLAVPFALVGVAAAALLVPFRVSRELRSALGWTLALVPITFLVAWQWLRALRDWIGLVLGFSYIPPAWMKLAALIVLIAGLGWLLARANVSAGIAALRKLLGGPVMLSFCILGVAIGWIAFNPPYIRGLEPPRGVQASTQGPDIFLITIDAASALDAQWCSDAGAAIMPEMRALARTATCFTRAYSASNFTAPATATLETGRLPWSHLNTQIAAKLPEPLTHHTLPLRLQQSGWRTFTLTDNILASPLQRGSSRGWDQAALHHAVPIDLIRGTLAAHLPASHLPMISNGLLSVVGALDRFRSSNPYQPEPLYKSMLSWLDVNSGPVFAWIHSMPPHAPYLPPASTRYKLLPPGQLERWKDFMRQSHYYDMARQGEVDKHRLRYRELMMAADTALGQLVRELKKRGRFDNALIVISSDHGESFERGYLGHAGTVLHEAVIRIPLLIKLPGQLSGRVVDQPVSQVDIPPTLMQVGGLEKTGEFEGRSLVPALMGERLEPRPVFTMSMERQSRFKPLRSGHFAVILDDHKLVLDLVGDASELYNLRLDPIERNNLVGELPDLAKELRRSIQDALKSAEARRILTVTD